MKFLVLALGATMSVCSFSQVAWDGVSNSPNSNNPLTGTPWSVYSNGGDVTVTIQPFEFNGAPGFNNAISASIDGGTTWHSVGNGYDFGTMLDLGTVSAGTEVLFSLGTGNSDTFYSGSLTPTNTDGQIHADVYNHSGLVTVDLEDLSASEGSDWNFGDGSVVVTNAAGAPTPEPASMTALALGAVAFLRRRRKA